ncbi:MULTISPECIES: hypothetical protein [Pseudomonas syringae group]|uniref:hypothetical protein n=1 Tax=Pseudomonas syringae group TaxID=136849 RepID=UPI000ADCE3CB|nr:MULTISPECIES: hypothetical protein [Pseudomonas syringae group]
MARTLSSAPSILCEKQMTIGLNEAYFTVMKKQLQKPGALRQAMPSPQRAKAWLSRT